LIRVSRTAAGVSIAAVGMFAVALASCAGPAPTTSRPPASPPGPSESATPAATGTPPRGPATIDATLLEVLPAEVDGLPVAPAPEALADALTNDEIVRNVAGIAAALAVDPVSGEFAYATVTRFFVGKPSDAFYRDWRDTFDAGVCEQAGGVSGAAEAEIGGRLVFIGSCASGVRTYHAWLGNRGVVVSVSSVGERRLGEHLVAGLRD
jgi:hypothetical protein